MNLKMAMKEVFDNAETYPEGWYIELAEIIRRHGGECYERRQKKVWMLTIREPDADADVVTAVYRTREGAKAAMEADILKTFNERYDNIAMESVIARDGELHAKMGDEADWQITHETLFE